MGDRWAALCATVDQETQQMQHKEEQVGGLPLLAMSLPVEEAGPDSCTNSSAKGAHRMEEAGDAGGDNAMAKKRRLVTPSGVIVHLGD